MMEEIEEKINNLKVSSNNPVSPKKKGANEP
jgi:hypothetical protein